MSRQTKKISSPSEIGEDILNDNWLMDFKNTQAVLL